MRTLRDAHDAFYAALDGVWAGDIAPMAALWSRQPDVTMFGRHGSRREGHDAVIDEFRSLIDRGVTGVVSDRDTRLVEFGDLGYSTCTEEGYNLADGVRIPVRHRATSIFRRERGGWRMVHHHSDRAEGTADGGPMFPR